jgi:hypothetical protein
LTRTDKATRRVIGITKVSAERLNANIKNGEMRDRIKALHAAAGLFDDDIPECEEGDEQ